ncbi:MAG: hypothetical protein RQ745_01085 [Longimicrobiales bacterium]|nr:hypothetical protein [Longimicrobiales bacterium]
MRLSSKRRTPSAEVGTVRASGVGRVVRVWLVTLVFWALAGGLAVWGIVENLGVGSPVLWGAALFAIPALHMVIHSLLVTARWVRFGRTELRLDPSPPAPGGDLGGTIEARGARWDGAHARERGRWRVTVSCIRTTIRSGTSSSNRRRWESVVWSETVEPRLERRARGVGVSFAVPLPAELPPTEPPSSSSSYHHWAVRLQATVPGLDLDHTFEVPVVASDAPAASTVEHSTPLGERWPLEALPRGAVRATRSFEGWRLHYPAGRDGVGAVVLTVVGVLFAGAGGFATWWSVDALVSARSFDLFSLIFEGVPLVMGVLFAGVGLLFIALGVYLIGNSLELRLTADEVITRRRFLGLPVARGNAPRAEIARLRVKVTGQTGQGAAARVQRAIVAETTTGVRLTLGDGLGSPEAVNALGSFFSEELGLPIEEVEEKEGAESTFTHPTDAAGRAEMRSS